MVTVTSRDREAFFEAFGYMAPDDAILDYKLGIKPEFSPKVKQPLVHNTDGSKTTFYDVKDCKDVDDIAEHWDLRGDEFNCLKAIAGIALGARHPGTTPIRDARKLVHYANRILARLEKSDES